MVISTVTDFFMYGVPIKIFICFETTDYGLQYKTYCASQMRVQFSTHALKICLKMAYLIKLKNGKPHPY